MTQQEMRHALIESTVKIIAENGLDKATTKAIATDAGLNEVYIYRVFGGKNEMFRDTFNVLDGELRSVILENISVMNTPDLDVKARCRVFFDVIWQFLNAQHPRCLCFIRYYYSPYFLKYSVEEHRKNYDSVVEAFTPAFKTGVDVWSILWHILDILLGSAVMSYYRISEGGMASDRVFELVYASVEPLLSWTE